MSYKLFEVYFYLGVFEPKFAGRKAWGLFLFDKTPVADKYGLIFFSKMKP